MRLLKLLLVFAICLSLSVVVFAHSGRTDSNGGHTDHGSEQYHYHHGYPAHQHSDLDGDGILDCPYLFKDKTESSESKTETPKKTEAQKRTKTFVYYAAAFVLLFVVGCYGFPLVTSAIKAIKQRFKK